MPTTGRAAQASGHTRRMADRSFRACCDKADPDLAVGETFDVPRPLSARTWTDDRGVTWRRRGQGSLTPKHARKLMSRAEVSVMHVCGGAVHEHLGPDRQSLAGEIEEYWAGRADPMASFEMGEFRDDAEHVMVMVLEGC